MKKSLLFLTIFGLILGYGLKAQAGQKVYTWTDKIYVTYGNETDPQGEVLDQDEANEGIFEGTVFFDTLPETKPVNAEVGDSTGIFQIVIEIPESDDTDDVNVQGYILASDGSTDTGIFTGEVILTGFNATEDPNGEDDLNDDFDSDPSDAESWLQ